MAKAKTSAFHCTSNTAYLPWTEGEVLYPLCTQHSIIYVCYSLKRLKKTGKKKLLYLYWYHRNQYHKLISSSFILIIIKIPRLIKTPSQGRSGLFRVTEERKTLTNQTEGTDRNRSEFHSSFYSLHVRMLSKSGISWIFAQILAPKMFKPLDWQQKNS